MADLTILEVHLDLDSEMTVGEAATIVDSVKRRLTDEEAGITSVIVEMNSAMDEPHGIAVKRSVPGDGPEKG